MQVNIIIPIYNESKRIGATLDKLFTYLDESVDTTAVITDTDIHTYIVNDGSQDNSVEIVNAKINNRDNFHLLNYQVNQGKGHAFKYGVTNSRKADFYYLADADGSAEWNVLSDFLDMASREKLDCVIGSRFTTDATNDRSLSKKITSSISNLMIRLVLNIPFKDTQCGYKLFRSSCYEYIANLKLNRFGFDFEILKRLYDAKLKIKEVGIIWYDKDGSTVKFRDYFRTFSELLKVRRG